MSDNSTAIKKATPLTYDAFLNMKAELEKYFSMPKPKYEFDTIWCSKNGLEKMIEELGAEMLQPSNKYLSWLSGINIVEFPISDNQVWLIQSPKSIFELPKIVAVVNLGVNHE